MTTSTSADLAEGALDGVTEVVLAMPDLQGRLQGVRLSVPFFTEQVLREGYGVCAYLLATDVDMTTGPGYAIDAEAEGFGDLLLRPDLGTLRRIPWQEGTALVLADAYARDGRTAVPVAPRQILRHQLDRLAALGLHPRVGTELEFLVFAESYQECWERDYRGLAPATRYNSDYTLLGLGTVDGMVRDIVRGMSEAGLAVESARAECHRGQYEIVFRHTEGLVACDNHVFYKTGAKQIAEAAGQAVTFIAKYDSGEGNSCHIHISLRNADDEPVFSGDAEAGMTALMEWFVAGQLACMRELTLLFAPTVNSYKRLQPGSFAPTAVARGWDDRTCAVRVIGTGPSLRIEHRVPGGDANPYLALSAIIAAGLYGIEHRLSLSELDRVPPETGDGELPRDLATAMELWSSSAMARKAFGDVVVEHYARAGRAELDAFAAAVTDWERRRGFERL